MSGGYFDYDQYRIGQIADQIEDLIFHNGHDEKDDYGCNRFSDYRPEIIDKFKTAVNILRIAQVYAQRVDWLVSGDDGEDCLLTRLKEDLMKLDVQGVITSIQAVHDELNSLPVDNPTT